VAAPRPESGAALAARTNQRLFWYGLLSNGVGAVIVLLFLIYLGPTRISDAEWDAMLERNIPAFVVYMLVGMPFGRWWAARRPFEPIAKWLGADRVASRDERAQVLGYPSTWAIRSMIIWAVAALVFAAINTSLGALTTVGAGAIILLGGLASCALQYLVVERIMRPITARALGGGAPPPTRAPGVWGRLTMAWILATGIFLLGIGGFAAMYLIDPSVDETRILGGILALAAFGVIGGVAAMFTAARSVAQPLDVVAQSLERVERGELDARVEVDDGSEVGQVQAGFNRMAAGLEERERIRAAFGTYLDREVAEHILREGTSLEGEEVEVTAMFLDIRDFTGFAERESAPVVVATINQLFERIVPIVHRHRGHIDKFVGDGFMAVFGAPERLERHADEALAAALEIASTLGDAENGGLEVGIGLNSGSVVAGNVGGAGRFDFSVMGDAINVAARVESATRQTRDVVLVSEHTMRALRDGGPRLEERPGIRLRGKRDQVSVFAPRLKATAR
jgi:adenylate cyclase